MRLARPSLLPCRHSPARFLCLRFPMLHLTQLFNYLTLDGSFSAVPTATMAREETIYSIFSRSTRFAVLSDLKNSAKFRHEVCRSKT